MPYALKVAVLMGGPSGEHEISLQSGHGVTDALRRRQFTVEPVVIPNAVSLEQACELVTHVLRGIHPDAVFIALHGTCGEDGTIQHVCEELQVPYTGSDSAASRLGMDKAASRRCFEAAGLSVPRWQLIHFAQGSRWEAKSWKLEAGKRVCSQLPASSPQRSSLQPSALTLELPMVVKPSSQGSSLGVSLVRRADELPTALAAAGRYGPDVLIEEFIAGREVTVGILDEEPLPVVEICPRQGFFDFTAKYTAGMTDYRVPAELPAPVAERVQAMSLAAHRALGCRHLSRADILLRDGRAPVLLEVNTIPGFTPTSLLPKAAACAGISYDALCERLVMMAIGIWQRSVEQAPA